MARTSILLYGDTGTGKTPQFGELAKFGYMTERRPSLLFTWDEGGTASIAPLVKFGVVEVVDCRGLPFPFDWMDEVTKGNKYNSGGTLTKIAPADLAKYYAIGFEGLTEGGDLLMREMSDLSAKGVNIGGGGAFSFKQGDKTIGSNNQSHYGQAQGHISACVKRSFRLPGDGYVVWTAAARRGEDADNKALILGPQIVGKALTSEVPRWFVYTFHLDRIAANTVLKQKEEFRLYFKRHQDASGAGVLGNDRLPMGVEPLPEYLAPTNVVRALNMIAAKSAEAEVVLQRELATLTVPETGV